MAMRTLFEQMEVLGRDLDGLAEIKAEGGRVDPVAYARLKWHYDKLERIYVAQRERAKVKAMCEEGPF